MFNLNYNQLQRKYNTLVIKYVTLKDQVKEDVFKNTLKIISEQDEVESLRIENKKLRKRIKELKKAL